MYFGSVRFFKHLIVTVVALLIIIPTALAVWFGYENSRKAEELAAIKSGTVEVSEDCTPDAMFGLYKDKLKDKAKFLNLIREYDDNFYDEIVKKPASTSAAPITDEPSVPANATMITSDTIAVPIEDSTDETDSEAETTTAPESDEPFETTDSAPAYTKILPELYAEGTSNITYDQDKDFVYLTFDDGPSKYTDNILYYLDLYDLKATFFVVPDGTEICAQRLKKIADAGHTIGIHSSTHVYEEIYASVDAFLDDFATAYNRVYDATGIKATLFRFPGGSINDFNVKTRDDIIAEMTRRGFVYFDWNVDSNDAMGASWTEMYNNVLSQTANTNRAVILMHDGKYNTVLVLEDIIRALISDSRGYKLAALTERVKPVQF